MPPTKFLNMDRCTIVLLLAVTVSFGQITQAQDATIEPTINIKGYVRKSNAGRELIPEKPLPSLGPKNYRSCPFAGESTATPQCPRMAAILQKSRAPTAAALAVHGEAKTMLKSTQDLFKTQTSKDQKKALFDTLFAIRTAPPKDVKRQKRATVCDLGAIYRTIDGTCNNLDFTRFGASNSPFRRILPPSYDDLLDKPRQASIVGGGMRLPSPRIVTQIVHPIFSRDDRINTHMVMQWGQFLDHDITLTPNSPVNDADYLCGMCNANVFIPECFPISVPDGDSFFPSMQDYGDLGVQRKCLTFTRSLNGQSTSGPREQLNTISSYIDASQIYGPDQTIANALRAFSKGKMAVQSGDLLPADPSPVLMCRSGGGKKCFKAGDERVNDMPSLAGMHTIWIREHNRIADILLQQKPSGATDEFIYQETRRIIGAMVQHITYNEWLPRIVGSTLMSTYGLKPLTMGNTYYNSTCDATLLNEFSSAALRFGHTLIQDVQKIHSDTGANDYRKLEETFFEPSEIYDTPNRFLEKMMKGLAEQRAQSYDPFFTAAVRDRLFEEHDKPFSGMDLVALNIQRGRDHGLQPYFQYRRKYNLPAPTTFDDLDESHLNIMYNDDVFALTTAYKDVRDIDLYSGMIAEKPISDGTVGPVAGNILAEQFSYLKKCDRFFYEHSGQTGSFTAAQLAQIRKTSLAKVLCTNTKYPFQAEVFKQESTSNLGSVPCDSLPKMDLTNWFQCTENQELINGKCVDKNKPPMQDCYDWLHIAGSKKSGLYTIHPPKVEQAFTVYCDMETDGGGWTLFHRRQDSSLAFEKFLWNDYKIGFQNNNYTNYWMGLDKLHLMTTKDSVVDLRVDIVGDRNPKSKCPTCRWNVKAPFTVGNQLTNYQLNLSPQVLVSDLPLLYRHNGAQFSTIDQDHDISPLHCAQYFHSGGWWFDNCFTMNLNGRYDPTATNCPYGLSSEFSYCWDSGADWAISANPGTSEMKLRKQVV